MLHRSKRFYIEVVMFSFLAHCFAARAEILRAERYIAALGEQQNTTSATAQVAAEAVEPERLAPLPVSLAA
jgi:hypothetical protein